MLSRSKPRLRRPRIICRPIILSATFRRIIPCAATVRLIILLFSM